MLLGLTGSLGSGKTTVSAMMEQRGVPVICADRIARAVTAAGTPAFQAIVSEFGAQIVAASGELDRPALAALVFADPAKRKLLESIVHPRVREREFELIAQFCGRDLVILDVPLLFESGLDRVCDATVVVWVDEAARRERLMRDRSMPADQIEARLKAQLSQDEKKRRATHLIDNSGTLDATQAQVDRLLARVLQDI